MQDLFSLKDKVAIVTGGARGIGLETARLFLEAGIKGLTLVDLQRAALEEALNHELLRFKDKILLVEADCADEIATARYVECTMSRFGRLDVSCQIAGISGPKCSIMDLTIDQWDTVLNTNLKSAFLGIKYSAKAMLDSPTKGQGCSISLCSSNMSHTGWPDYAPYVSSKSGIRGLAACAAQELGEAGIRVNAVSPGAFVTEMTKKFLKNNLGAEQQLKERIPLDRIGLPTECARMFFMLATDFASYVSGTTLGASWIAAIPLAKPIEFEMSAVDGGMARSNHK